MSEVSWEDREALRERPSERVAYKQKWRDLLFLHFPMDPNEMRPLLPEGLDIDLYPDQRGRPSAWVGIVAFRMEGIRAMWSPTVPWLSAFAETNVRTYVLRGGKDPGVWFFSLEAERWLACKIARAQFGLAYWHARMTVQRQHEVMTYVSDRIEGKGLDTAALEAVATFGPASGIADPRTADFWFVERYLAYMMKGADLYSARVWHRPYPLRGAKLESCHQSLTTANALPTFPWEHVIFSDGVDVDLFKPVRL